MCNLFDFPAFGGVRVCLWADQPSALDAFGCATFMFVVRIELTMGLSGVEESL